jgi:hypothetical protein
LSEKNHRILLPLCVSAFCAEESRCRKFEKNNRYVKEKSYFWASNDRLLQIITDGKVKRFDFDGWGNLSKTIFEDGNVERRNPDRSGNLFERLDRKDRKYERGAKWRYEWTDAGMLSKVKRPDAREIFFKYDALGRRIEKQFGNVFTRWVWDGNTPLHEQGSHYTPDWDEVKKEVYDRETKYPLITWVFEEGTFVPAAKITEKQKLSIATNYLGTREAMSREDGEAVWICELNSYGRVRNFQGESKTMCPFRYQGAV